MAAEKHAGGRPSLQLTLDPTRWYSQAAAERITARTRNGEFAKFCEQHSIRRVLIHGRYWVRGADLADAFERIAESDAAQCAAAACNSCDACVAKGVGDA